MTIEIPLSQGYVSLVDDGDAVRVLAAGKWFASVKPKTIYAGRNIVTADGRRTSIRLHNFLTDWRFVDHRNGDGLDNRRANLRPATQATNARNVGLNVRNSSGYKGVTWQKSARKWQAQIAVDGRRIQLGLFVDPLEAAYAYDAAATDLHGEFARVNFPTESVA